MVERLLPPTQASIASLCIVTRTKRQVDFACEAVLWWPKRAFGQVLHNSVRKVACGFSKLSVKVVLLA